MTDTGQTAAIAASPRPRWYGFDLLRLVSFFAIATFHISLIHYFTPQIDIASESIFIRAAEQVSRLLSFSGFTICFLTSVLTAYSGASIAKRLKLFTFLTIGWFVFSALMSGPYLLAWDIYPLILTGILSATLAEAAGVVMCRSLGAIGFLLLLVPWWKISGESWPRDLANVMGFGDCYVDNTEWPVLPWIGLVWLGYASGRELRTLVARGRVAVLKLRPGEIAGWGLLLAASIPNLGGFYAINLGRFFACDAYRQPPLVWWSHFIWVLALMRLTVEPRVHAWMEKRRFFAWISGLAVSRKFWLAYILNYLLCYLLSWIVSESGVEQTAWNVPTIAVIAVFFLPFTEVVLRGLLWLIRWIYESFDPRGATTRRT